MFEAQNQIGYLNPEAEELIDNFVNYFTKNVQNIKDCIDNRDKSFLKSFDDELRKVYPTESKGLRYCFFKQDDSYIFEFYYGRNSYLLTITDELFSKLRSVETGFKFINLKKQILK